MTKAHSLPWTAAEIANLAKELQHVPFQPIWTEEQHERVREACRWVYATPARPKVIWPEPGKTGFDPDGGHNPMNVSHRHASLHRREEGIYGDKD